MSFFGRSINQEQESWVYQVKMEITATSQLCSQVKFSISSSLFCLNGNSKRNQNGAVSVNCLKEIKQFSNISFTAKKKHRNQAPVVRTTTRASVVDENQPQASATTKGERWLLQPVGKNQKQLQVSQSFWVYICSIHCIVLTYLTGDGDTRHIGYKVEMPAPFEISSVRKQ